MEDLLESSGSWPWRALNCVTTLFFAVAAYVQLNDPDPVLWVPLYAVPALLCFAVVVTPTSTTYVLWNTLSIVHASVCAVASLYFGSIGFQKGTLNPLKAEEGREFAGLLLVALWLLLCSVRSVPAVNRSTINCFLVLLAVLPASAWLYWHFREQYNWQLPDHCQGSFGDL